MITLASLDNMLISKQRITKALIRLRRCAGWSAPLLFANPRRQVVSRRGLFDNMVTLQSIRASLAEGSTANHYLLYLPKKSPNPYKYNRASGKFRHLTITLANSLGPDQDR